MIKITLDLKERFGNKVKCVRCDGSGETKGFESECLRQGLGFIFFSRKSDIFTFPTKQIHCESFLKAFGSQAFLAISLTSDFCRCPIGNIDFES